MAFQDELAQMVQDCHDILGEGVSVTITKVPAGGPLDPETGERLNSGTTDYTGTAIVSERVVDSRGATQTVEVTYWVRVAEFSSGGAGMAMPVPGWRIAHGGVTREICRVERQVRDLAVGLVCRDVRKN